MFVSKIRTVEIKTKINTYFFDKIVDDDKKPIEKLKETILKDLYNDMCHEMIKISTNKRIEESKYINDTLKTIMKEINEIKENKSNKSLRMLPLQERNNIEYQYNFIKFLFNIETTYKSLKHNFFKTINSKVLLISVINIEESLNTNIKFTDKYLEYYKDFYSSKIRNKLIPIKSDTNSLVNSYYDFIIKYQDGITRESINNSKEPQELELTTSVETALYFSSPFNIISINERDAESMLDFKTLKGKIIKVYLKEVQIKIKILNISKM